MRAACDKLTVSTMEHLTGTVIKYTVAKADFRVAKFRMKGQPDEITVAGAMQDFAEGEELELHGEWGEYVDRKRNKIDQFKVMAAFRVQPENSKGLERYLATAIPGIGPHRARLMMKHFGDKLVDVLNNRPDKLLEIKGMGQSSLARIAKGWRDDALLRRIGQFLASLNVNPKWARQIYLDLGPNAVQVITKNPYKLVNVDNIGFVRADEIAKKMGFAEDSPDRADSIIMFQLEEEAKNEGHVCCEQEGLISKAAEKYKLAPALAREALERVVKQNRLARERITTNKVAAGYTDLVYLPRLFKAETHLALKLNQLLVTPVNKNIAETQNLEMIVKGREQALGIELTDEQRNAVLSAFEKPISILTGGPGTGKTLCAKVIVDVAQFLGYKLAMCAPTGRAAKHLSTVANEKAYTIHRLLKYNADANAWTVNEKDPLDAHLVIADEFSMVDIELAHRLFDAVKPGTPMLIIGDKDQLPAVGPGRVLEDLVTSGRIHISRLTKIFRQAEKSLIVKNAHAILKGEMPTFPDKKDGAEMVDSYLSEPPFVPALDEKGKQLFKTNGAKRYTESQEWVKNMLRILCKDRIPGRLGIDPIKDIQVMTPMRKGPLGVYDLNDTLQETLNPDGRQVEIGSKRFRIGDRVMQTRNNYALNTASDAGGVFNGDIGFITEIDEEEKLLHIDFCGEQIEYPFEDVSDLTLAYCMSIHKSQGGEFPAVICVLLTRNFIMLQKNLLYTAVTRAKNLMVFISKKFNIEAAAKNNEIAKRHTFLTARLKKPVQETKAVA